MLPALSCAASRTRSARKRSFAHDGEHRGERDVLGEPVGVHVLRTRQVDRGEHVAHRTEVLRTLDLLRAVGERRQQLELGLSGR